MELNSKERATIWATLVASYPLSYKLSGDGLRFGGGGLWGNVLTDDALIKAVKRLAGEIRGQLDTTQDLLIGIESDRSVCLHCGEPYGIRRSNQKYCHRHCRIAASQQRYRHNATNRKEKQ